MKLYDIILLQDTIPEIPSSFHRTLTEPVIGWCITIISTMSAFGTHAAKTQAVRRDEQQGRWRNRQPDQNQLKRRREENVQKQQRGMAAPDPKNKKRPLPSYTKDVLKDYNQRVYTDNQRLTDVVKRLTLALAATKTKLEAEEQESFDTRFQREEAINFSCLLLQRTYHEGFTGALKMFTQEYGSEKYDGRCAAPLIVNDKEFEDAVAGGYTAWSRSLAYPPAQAQEDAIYDRMCGRGVAQLD